MAESELMSCTDIKNEDASDVIDLGDFDEYEWNSKVLNKLKECIVAHSERTLDVIMRWYIESLTEDTRNFADYTILKMFTLKHVQFFKLYFLELNCGFADNYLDCMEDILAFYVDLEVKSAPIKDNNMSNERYKRIIKRIFHKISNILNAYLLGQKERQYHVLMKMKDNGFSNETKDLLNFVYKKFLTVTPADKSELAFCRVYILLQKWKKIHKPTEWPQMDKIVYEMYDQTPVSIKHNAVLRQILIPNNRSIYDVLTLISDNYTFMLEEYFKYIKLENFQEEAIASISGNVNEMENSLLFTLDKNEENQYKEYLKLFSGASTNNSDSVIQVDDDDDDDDCQILEVAVSSSSDCIYEVLDNEDDDDDDILEVTVIPPKEKEHLSFIDSIDLTEPTPQNNASCSQQPLSSLRNILQALPEISQENHTDGMITEPTFIDEASIMPVISLETEINRPKNVVTVETQTEIGVPEMDSTASSHISDSAVIELVSNAPLNPQITQARADASSSHVASPHIIAAEIAKEMSKPFSNHVANIYIDTPSNCVVTGTEDTSSDYIASPDVTPTKTVSKETKDTILNHVSHQVNQTDTISEKMGDSPSKSTSSSHVIEESRSASPEDIIETSDNDQQPVKIAEKNVPVIDTTTKPAQDVLSKATKEISVKPTKNGEQPDSHPNLTFLADWISEPDSESADSGKYPTSSSSLSLVNKTVLPNCSKSLTCSDISSTSFDIHENEKSTLEKNDFDINEANPLTDFGKNRSNISIDSSSNMWMDETVQLANEEVCHLEDLSRPASNNSFEEDLSSSDTLELLNQNIRVKSLKINLENILEERKAEQPMQQKIMYTSPMKTCSNSNETLHARYRKLKETHNLDRILNGEVLNGPIAPVAKVNSSKSFDLFDNKISATTVEQISPQPQMPTNSTTHGDAKVVHYNGKDDFQSYYGDSDMVPSPTLMDRVPREKPVPVIKEMYNNSQNLGTLETNHVISKRHSDTDPKPENYTNTVKRKRMMFSKNLVDTENIRIHSPFENSNGAVHGIIKKTLPLEDKGSATKRIRNRIPKRLMNLNSLAMYNIKPDDSRLQSDLRVKLNMISKEEMEKILRLGAVAQRMREEKQQRTPTFSSLVRVDYNKETSHINEYDLVLYNSPDTVSPTLQQWRSPAASPFQQEQGNGMPGLPYINTKNKRMKKKSTFLEDGISRTVGKNGVYRDETEETLTENVGLLGNVRKRRRVEKDYDRLVRGRYQRNSSLNKW